MSDALFPIGSDSLPTPFGLSAFARFAMMPDSLGSNIPRPAVGGSSAASPGFAPVMPDIPPPTAASMSAMPAPAIQMPPPPSISMGGNTYNTTVTNPSIPPPPVQQPPAQPRADIPPSRGNGGGGGNGGGNNNPPPSSSGGGDNRPTHTPDGVPIIWTGGPSYKPSGGYSTGGSPMGGAYDPLGSSRYNPNLYRR